MTATCSRPQASEAGSATTTSSQIDVADGGAHGFHTVPMCICCGNRTVFLLETAHATIRFWGNEVTHLESLDGIICGRCRARHSVLLDREQD